MITLELVDNPIKVAIVRRVGSVASMSSGADPCYDHKGRPPQVKS